MRTYLCLMCVSPGMKNLQKHNAMKSSTGFVPQIAL
jgi:hypothetical protein